MNNANLTLSRENFDKAATYIRYHARPLDLALFDFTFNDGSLDEVTAELSRYLNPDGGFGHGLEPDAFLPDSNVYHTTVALQYLTEVNAPITSPLVLAALKYLMESFDPVLKTWHNMPPSVNDYPHAFWWEYQPENHTVLIDENGDDFTYNVNPSVEVVGYLLRYSDLIPTDFLNDAVARAITSLDFLDDPLEGHDLLCLLKFSECLEGERSRAFQEKLTRRALAPITTNPADWESGYVLLPHTFVTTPDSLLVKHLGESINQSLAYTITHQESDGSWGPSWQWDPPEAWAQAKIAWTGKITTDFLIKLHRFNMIET